MAKTLLITFGCSWTYGVGVNYEDGMSKNALKGAAWNQIICNQFSWRGLLCQKHDMVNQNFSAGGSSNQRQFRLAMEFFGSELYATVKKLFDKIIVLWGITSTARNELWCAEQNAFHNFSLTNSDDLFANFMAKHSYAHDAEVHNLRNFMLFWNRFFHSEDIENFWFDTFNTHNYDYDFLESTQHSNHAHPRGFVSKSHYLAVAGPDWPTYHEFVHQDFANIQTEIVKEIESIFGHTPAAKFPQTLEWSQRKLKPIPNLIDNDQYPRDLMSWLMQQQGISIDTSQQEFHYSEWKIDRDSMQQLVDLRLLNPHTFHPTKTAHKLFCEFFSDRLGITLR